MTRADCSCRLQNQTKHSLSEIFYLGLFNFRTSKLTSNISNCEMFSGMWQQWCAPFSPCLKIVSLQKSFPKRNVKIDFPVVVLSSWQRALPVQSNLCHLMVTPAYMTCGLLCFYHSICLFPVVYPLFSNIHKILEFITFTIIMLSGFMRMIKFTGFYVVFYLS